MIDALHTFFAAPEPTLGFALCRLLLGVVLVADGLRMLAEHDLWYGRDALRPDAPHGDLLGRLDPFHWVAACGGSSRHVVRAWVLLAAAFAAGIATPVSGAALLYLSIFVPLRNLWVVYGGDAFARTILLLLLFAPCDASLSVDRLVGDGSLGLDATAPPWGGRLVQLEVALLYAFNFIAKVRSRDWRAGRVMSELLANGNFAKSGVPAVLRHPRLGAWMTWGGLVAELAFAPGLWWEPTRAPTLVAAVLFHLLIARLVDVHLFSYVMVAALASFFPSELVGAASAGGAATAGPDAGGAVALVAACGYMFFMVAWDPPPPFPRWSGLRRLLGPFLDRVQWVRSWHLFTDSSAQELAVEMVIVHPDGAVERAPFRAPPARGHRLERFKFSLMTRPESRAALARYIHGELAAAGAKPRALSIDALFIDVGPGRAVLGGQNLHTRMRGGRDRAFDSAGCAALAGATRCPSTRARLLDLLRLAHAHPTPPSSPGD